MLQEENWKTLSWWEDQLRVLEMVDNGKAQADGLSPAAVFRAVLLKQDAAFPLLRPVLSFTSVGIHFWGILKYEKWPYPYTVSLQPTKKKNICETSQDRTQGTSLVILWLRGHAPNAGGLGSIPGGGIRSHMSQIVPWATRRSLMPQLRFSPVKQ